MKKSKIRRKYPVSSGRLKVTHKYWISLVASIAWASASVYLARFWIEELGEIIGYPLAAALIYGIAIIPGWMNAFIAASLILDNRPTRSNYHPHEYPPISIIIAAYNEEASIADTIESVNNQDYHGYIQVIVANDGSRDGTAGEVRRLQVMYPWLTLLDCKVNRGKSHVLNDAMELVDTELVITLDGDSFLHDNAITHIVERYMTDNRREDNVAAVAGSILVRNSEVNLCTRAQTWDYYLGIGATKRLQSFYHGTLVAQGAFSLYRSSVLREVGCWPHCVGEDIVLTWAILNQGYRVGYAEDAIIFTNCPERWGQFIKQRQRWSRGLVEAFKAHWTLLFKPRLTTIFIWWNLMFPYLDLAYTFGFVPGVILAFAGIFWIAGPMTLLLLPFSMILNYIMFREQERVVRSQKIDSDHHWYSFVFYTLLYSMVLQPACVYGYIQEFFFGKIKNWGTK